MVHQDQIVVDTRGRGTIDLTARIAGLVAHHKLAQGICQLFLQHTSASLMLCENADPSVRRDLEGFLSRLAPDGDPHFSHIAEGDDDMPAHIRSVLLGSCLSVPVAYSRLLLGTWQGIYLYEHRTEPHRRVLLITLLGDPA